MTKSPAKKLIILTLVIALIASVTAIFTACGSSDSDAVYDYFVFTREANGLVLTGVNSSGLPSAVVVPEYYYEASDTNRETKISVIGIGAAAFKNQANLKSVSLPSSVTSIADEAFSGCSGLTTINTDKVSSIGTNAFYNCKSLANITLSSESNITISDSAFYGCWGLRNVNGTGKVTSLGREAFGGCISLMSVDVDWSGLTSIGEKAFFFTVCINTFEVPAVCSSVGDNAFEGWTASQFVFSYKDYTDGWKNGSAANFISL